MKIPLNQWCFCACCCYGEDRTPLERAECTCKVRLSTLIEQAAELNARVSDALRAIEKESWRESVGEI